MPALTKIDLGGIAKGFAVDLAIHTLRQYGIKYAVVNAGGDSQVNQAEWLANNA